MKTKFYHISLILLLIIGTIGCGSSKKGCGLTSDATIIQPNENEVLASVENK
ncbi:MAG TPA: hypothetical protein VJ970_02580 [Flavobacteriaceae bacterium]|nr:hypothetical protein [Flavobacteriaceae bacterium]